MADQELHAFKPDYAVPPGKTLREILEHIGMSQAELAERTGRPKKTINQIVKGIAPISAETALQLERVLGVPAGFWNQLESNYREAKARQNERKRLKRELHLLKVIPWRNMVKYSWIDKLDDEIEQLKEVLNFFGAASPQNLKLLQKAQSAAFRKSPAYEANPWAILAWLRKGSIEAQRIECRPYNKTVFRRSLESIRALTCEPPEVLIPQMRDSCTYSGVALVFVRELPKSRASGASRWLTPSKALIQLTLRYKSADHLWFTFFHEAGHILLHGKREEFIDEEHPGGDEREEKANRFAEDMLIPPDDLKEFIEQGYFNESSIKHFADEFNIDPGIVVGRLQHYEKIEYDSLNHLKKRIEWKQIEEILFRAE